MSDAHITEKERALWHQHQCAKCIYSEKLSGAESSKVMCAYLNIAKGRGRRNCSIRMCERFKPKPRRSRNTNLAEMIYQKTHKAKPSRADGNYPNGFELRQLVKHSGLSPRFVMKIMDKTEWDAQNMREGRLRLTDAELSNAKAEIAKAVAIREKLMRLSEESCLTFGAMAASCGLDSASIGRKVREAPTEELYKDLLYGTSKALEARRTLESILRKENISAYEIDRHLGKESYLRRNLKNNTYSLSTHKKAMMAIEAIRRERKQCQK